MREIVLSHLHQKEFKKIIEILKDNKTFDNLIQDEIFKTIFFENFTTELFKQENLELSYPAFLYQCHKSKDYIFEFNEEDEEKILIFLIDKTEDYNYATKLPKYKTSVEIINNYKKRMEIESENAQRLAKKSRDFEIVEKYSDNTENLIKSIFNSPQEKEFYIACKLIFHNKIILPNVSLTTLFNQNIVKNKFPNYYNFYLKSSIDFVIVDEESFIPILFFELDSKTFHSDNEAKTRDEIKNLLVTELGNSLIRISKRTGKESIDEYQNLLLIIKEEKNIS